MSAAEIEPPDVGFARSAAADMRRESEVLLATITETEMEENRLALADFVARSAEEAEVEAAIAAEARGCGALPPSKAPQASARPYRAQSKLARQITNECMAAYVAAKEAMT